MFQKIIKKLPIYNKDQVNIKKIKKKYRNILEEIKEGYYEANIRGEFKFINTSMCTLLEREEIEIIGTSIISHLESKYIPGFNTLFNQIKNIT